MPIGKALRSGLTGLCTLVVCAAPVLAQDGGATQSIYVQVCTPEGAPLAEAVVAARTAEGMMVKAQPQAQEGLHYATGLGLKTTIELQHPVYGTTFSEVTLPGNAQDVVLEILMGSDYAPARVLGGAVAGTCPGDGNCCEANGTPGCDDVDCCNLVCAIDPFCCDVSWDGLCAGEAEDLCGDLCLVGGPANDDCANAIPIDVPSSTEGTTEGATDDGQSFCGTSVTVGGVWYSVTGTGNTLTATTCTDFFDYDTKLSVFCFGCDEKRCVTGNDDNCPDGASGLLSTVSWCTTDGAEYLIFVHGFSSGQGDFVLEVSDDGIPCTPTNPCAELGACCLPDGDCQTLTEANCLDADGEYQGDGTACEGEHVFNVEECTSPFEDISGTGIVAPSASNIDDAGDVVPIGFTFDFFKDTHDTIGVCSNGYLTFGSDLSDFTNDPVPTLTDPNDGIFPLWDDWSPNQAGTVYYQTLGAAGSQRFIAQWEGVPHFNSGGSSTFQAVLFEGSNCIEFRYGPLNYDSPTVGVENQDGSDGYPGGFGPVVGAGDCLRLCPEQIGGFVCPTGIDASVDIKPGSCPNSFNRNSNGVLPVALVGTDDLDANLVDISSLTLSRADGVGGSVSPNEGPPGPHTTIDDVATPFPGEPCDCHELTGDGIDDVSMKFKSQEVVDLLELDGEPNGALIELVLSGTLLDGTAFEGSDCIRLVPPGTPPGVLLVGSNLPNIWVDLYPLDEQLDEGGFTSFNRSFPQSTTVFLSVPVTPSAFPTWKLASYFIDGVEYPYTGNSQSGQMFVDIEIAGESNVLALKYKFYGSFQVPDFDGATQD